VSRQIARFLGSTIGPALGLLLVVFLGPFLFLVWLSLTDTNLVSGGLSGHFVGFNNYARALRSDSEFLASLGRSALFASYCVLPQICFSIVAAEVLHTSKSRLVAALMPLLLLSSLLPPVVVGLYWRVMLQGEFGVLSYYLTQLGIDAAGRLLSTPATILATLAIVDFWQWCPFVLLVFLVVRGTVASAPLEASWIDGASRLQSFFEITIPAMLPSVFLVGFLRSLDSLKEFDKVYVMTGGGPGSASELVSLYIWRTAFKQWDFGYAAALSVLLYVMIFLAVRGIVRFRGLRIVDNRR